MMMMMTMKMTMGHERVPGTGSFRHRRPSFGRSVPRDPAGDDFRVLSLLFFPLPSQARDGRSVPPPGRERRRGGTATDVVTHTGEGRRATRSFIHPFIRVVCIRGDGGARPASLFDAQGAPRPVRRSPASELAFRLLTDGTTKCGREGFGLPTLRQAWPREYPRPQYAFKMSMFNVSCNSH